MLQVRASAASPEPLLNGDKEPLPGAQETTPCAHWVYRVGPSYSFT